MTTLDLGPVAPIELLDQFVTRFEQFRKPEKISLHDLRVALFEQNGSFPSFVYGQIEIIKGTRMAAVVSGDTVDILNMIYCRKNSKKEPIAPLWANNAKHYAVGLAEYIKQPDVENEQRLLSNSSLKEAQLMVHESARSRILVTQGLADALNELKTKANGTEKLKTGSTVLIVYQGAQSTLDLDKLV